MSILIPLADAVVQELREPVEIESIAFTEFSQRFTVKRTYNTEQKLEDGGRLQVFVVPGRSPFELSSRSGLQSNRDIAIFVRQKMDVDDIEKVDALVAFLEELNTYFVSLPNGARLTYFNPDAHYLQSEITPFFPTRLRGQREYLGVLVLTFRIYEDE
jgi:hypothetical protein